MDQHHSNSHFHHHHHNNQQHNNHHRTRYAPFPAHHHHHHHHLPPALSPPPTLPPMPPLPSQPQPQPFSYRNIHTPPPPPPSHQSQYPFNPPNYPHPHRPLQEESLISTNHMHIFPQSPRISNRILAEDTYPRRNFPDFDPENSWNPKPSVVPENRPPRNYPPLDLDREMRHRPMDLDGVPPPPYPNERIRYDPEGGSSRIRIEYDGNPREEEFAWGRGGDENYHHRRVGDVAPGVDLPKRGLGMAPAMSREIGVDSGPAGYVRVYDGEFEGEASRIGRREGHGESKRWVNGRKGPREILDSQFESANSQIGAASNGNDFRMMSNREYYGSESGRYSGRGSSRDCGHEFSRTPPKKQIQKKSALLRLQTVKQSYRNRETEQSQYFGYAADTNSNFFRAKDQHGYSGHGTKAEERKGSPVEVDISFESNSLVAKAIVAPSSLVVVSGTNMASGSNADLTSSEKGKNILESEIDCSGLQLAKLSTCALNRNCSPCKANESSGSIKDLSPKKNVIDTCSQPCSSLIGNPNEKNEVAISGENIKSSGKSSPRVVKKKKIVKRVVRKVAVKPNSPAFNSLSANTVQAGNVNLSSSTISDPNKVEPSLEEKSITIDKESMLNCSYDLPNEKNVLPEDNKVCSSLLSLEQCSRSEECKPDKVSDIEKFAKGQKVSNSSSFVSSNEDRMSDSDCLDANNSVHDLLSMSNTDKVNKSLRGFCEISHMDSVNKLLSQSQESLSTEKYSNVGCLDNRYDTNELNCRLLSSASNIVHQDVINTYNSGSDKVYGLSSSDLTGSGEKPTITNNNTNVVVGKTSREVKGPTTIQYATLEENRDTSIPVLSSVMLASSSSEISSIETSPDNLQNSSLQKQGSDDGPPNLDGTSVHRSVMSDAENQMCPIYATVSPENGTTEKGVPNSNISVDFVETGTNKMKMRIVETHLKGSCPKMEGISPERITSVSHANDGATASSLRLKNPCSAEVLDESVKTLDFNSHPCLDEVITLPTKKGLSESESSVGDDETEDANKISPVSKMTKAIAIPPNISHCQSELNDVIVVSTSCAEIPINFSDEQAHQKEVSLLRMDILSSSLSMPYSEDIIKLSDNILIGGSCKSMHANRKFMSSEQLELKHPDIASFSARASFSMLDVDQEENSTPIVSVSNMQTDMSIIGSIKEEKTNLQPVERNYSPKDSVKISPCAGVESNNLNMKDDLIPQQNLALCLTNGGVTTSNSNVELIEDTPDAKSDFGSEGMTLEVPSMGILDSAGIHNDNSCQNEENLEMSAVERDSALPTFGLSIQNTKKIDKVTGRINQIMRNLMPQPSQIHSKSTTQGLKLYASENGRKHKPGGVVRKTYKGNSFTFSKSKANTSTTSNHISNPRTWHRSGNTSASLPGVKLAAGTSSLKRPILESKANIQNTSYIRKGNSLVRQPIVSASPQISSTDQSSIDELPKSPRSESGVDVTDQPSLSKTGVTNATHERQRSPPRTTDTPSEEKSSPLAEPSYEDAMDPRSFIETKIVPNSSEDCLKHHETPDNQTCLPSNGESQVEADDGNISSLSTKKIVYIKPKTNQLVATSNSCDISVSIDDKSQTAFSDSYYKRSNNQLVRTTFESHINQAVATPNTTVDSEGQGSRKVLCNRRFGKRRSLEVDGSSCKPLRASLVWTLCGKNSFKIRHNSWHYQKVLPNLFPWKRATYLRSFIHSSASSSNGSSLPSISKKLLLLRKMNAVYTRSTHGFSLWKSKVLGVGGSSLKWSKSIEKHSKLANEEATLAVAAVERKKREQKDATCIGSQPKRERIFRIGSVRYRMDPSRRTLQRISDDESLSSASPHSGLATKRAYIPRRLVIGNDEYVRIGNGNQLIRDPKKRTRKLANEKVRWSLHTARQRLARKQKYCQFFTRFGKCNKEDGKCPYIHDASKIAVCTKFLNGFCSTPNCKLTHKVIPERMPDCSYFLQGLCTNRNCPYRHVNVNPKASVCQGFLKGYCADGNECRKKHSYVCPTYQATGTCSQGTTCKLHHPRKEKGKKRKRAGDQHNGTGRYFGSVPIDVSEPGVVVGPRQHEQNDNRDGELSDYISLDCDEEIAETVSQSFEQAFSESDSLDSLDLQLDNYEHIKPILIMETKSRSNSLQT